MQAASLCANLDVYLWIAHLKRFQAPINAYNKPVSSEAVQKSRAEINRDSVYRAVEQALAMDRVGGDGIFGQRYPAFPESALEPLVQLE